MQKGTNKSFLGYLTFILKSPLSAWWAIATGLIGVLSFNLLSPTYPINRLWITTVILVTSFLLFIAITVILKAWPLYLQNNKPLISQIVKVDNECIFLLAGLNELGIGTLLEVYRKHEFVEISIGFIEITHQTSEGLYQAKPVWIMPVHLRDIESRELSHESLSVYTTLTTKTLTGWINRRCDNIIQSLLKKGKSS